MSVSKNDYSKMTDKASPNSPIFLNCLKAFVFGGGLCTFAQVLNSIYQRLGMSEDEWRLATPATVIVITAVLTGVGVYDKIAKHCGAGTLIPITGFSNAVTSSAIEFKNEGFILGVGDNIFKIAGPVILYGTSASIIYGFIYYIVKTIGG